MDQVHLALLLGQQSLSYGERIKFLMSSISSMSSLFLYGLKFVLVFSLFWILWLSDLFFILVKKWNKIGVPVCWYEFYFELLVTFCSLTGFDCIEVCLSACGRRRDYGITNILVSVCFGLICIFSCNLWLCRNCFTYKFKRTEVHYGIAMWVDHVLVHRYGRWIIGALWLSGTNKGFVSVVYTASKILCLVSLNQTHTQKIVHWVLYPIGDLIY